MLRVKHVVLLLPFLVFYGCSSPNYEALTETRVPDSSFASPDETSLPNHEAFELQRAKVLGTYKVPSDLSALKESGLQTLSKSSHTVQALGAVGEEYPPFSEDLYAAYLMKLNPSLSPEALQEQVETYKNQIGLEILYLTSLKISSGQLDSRASTQGYADVPGSPELSDAMNEIVGRNTSALVYWYKYKDRLKKDLLQVPVDVSAEVEKRFPGIDASSNRADAYRHMLTTIYFAKLFEWYGNDVFTWGSRPSVPKTLTYSISLMTAHELAGARTGSNLAYDTAMDLHNNAVGADVYLQNVSYDRKFDYYLLGRSKPKYYPKSPSKSFFADRVFEVVNTAVLVDLRNLDGRSSTISSSRFQAYLRDRQSHWLSKTSSGANYSKYNRANVDSKLAALVTAGSATEGAPFILETIPVFIK